MLDARCSMLNAPMKIPQSVSWWCFVPQRMSPTDFLETVARIGYTALDLVPVDQLSTAQSYGLKIAAIGGHDSIEIGLNRRDQHERIRREIEGKLELAVRYEIPNLICFSGSRSATTSEADGAAITAEGLAALAPLAEKAGVNLVLELLNSRVDHPGYQADHTEWGVRVCSQVNSARVRLLYDVYHMQIMEGDIIRTIQNAHPWIAHYHTAGNPGRNDLDDAQELNYPAILRAIKATGYEGYIAHEFVPKTDPAVALERTYQHCAAVLGGSSE
jgi:hydroxypyruvate isomerase